jgi:hypothetical protein
MVDKIKLVQGDTRPALVCTLTDESTNLAINIGGATPRLKFRALGAATLTATVIGTVTDGANGICVFFPASAPEMLSGTSGDYEGEIEITFDNGEIQTIYDILRFKVREEF